MKGSTDREIEHPTHPTKRHSTTIRSYTDGHITRINTDHTTNFAHTPLKSKTTLFHHIDEDRIKTTRNPISDARKKQLSSNSNEQPQPTTLFTARQPKLATQVDQSNIMMVEHHDDNNNDESGNDSEIITHDIIV